MEDISADTAAEAMEDLFLTGDGKGWRLFGVEGTEGFVIPTTALEREILGDDIDDVVASTDLFDHFLGDVISHDRSLECGNRAGA
jgi:hypothetical protein